MKLIEYCIYIIVCLLLNPNDGNPGMNNGSVTIMSYNIHYAINMNGEYNLLDIAETINSSQVDIAGLQEIKDSLMADELSKLTGLNVIFCPSLDRNDGYGDAILSRFPMKLIGSYSIPSASSSRYQVTCVEIDIPGKTPELFNKVRLINTHFDWLKTLGSEKARLASVDLIEDAFFYDGIKSNMVTFLTADLNSLPESDVLNSLYSYGWINTITEDKNFFTHSSVNPTKQIDYILYRIEGNVNFHVKNYYVDYGNKSSDHLPLIMEIYFD